MKKIYTIFTLSLLLIVTSCGKEDNVDELVDITTTTPETTTPTPTAPTVTLSTVINDFIWKGLNQYYYWQEEVNDLSDSKFDNDDDYVNYLNTTPDNETFFESLKHPDDRFSWIESDYEVLENQLSGISASNGMKFIVYRRASDSDGLIAVVTYVLPNSSAAEQGVVRGDLFNIVNNQELNISNYYSLLYGDDLEYSIELVNFDPNSNIVTSRGITKELTKEIDFQEIPVHKNQIIDIGDKRIGYVMYNRFLSTVDTDGDGTNEYDFNQLLIDTFADLGNQNITDLVLDLRYNPGGSVQTCTYLASLITGQFNGEIFAKQLWNTKLMEYFEERNIDNNNYFVSQTTSGVPLPSLQLNKIYVLVSNRSASASELLINGLAPYIEVVKIGTNTVGKNVGSITLYDYVDDNGTKNSEHKYAMQPIVLKIANKLNYADYADGLDPTVELRESIVNYGILGDQNEPLLAKAIEMITGTSKIHNTVSDHIFYPAPDKYEMKNQKMFVDLPIKSINQRKKLK